MSGIDLIIALIGLFAISEIMMKSQYDPKKDHKTISASAITKDKITKDEYRRCRKPIALGSLIGVIIGATPGTGGGLAAFISYNQTKQASKHPETFGHGEIEGVAASESANNGACGATMIPMLTLGVPGDGATAILMGAFMIHGMIPGPTLFKEQGNILYAIMLGLIVVNVFMYILGSGFTRFYAHITRIPYEILAAIVLTFCKYLASDNVGRANCTNSTSGQSNPSENMSTFTNTCIGASPSAARKQAAPRRSHPA